MKLPQHRAFFLLMSLHPLQDVGKHSNRCDRIGSLVQHNAFGAFAHRSVSNFRA